MENEKEIKRPKKDFKFNFLKGQEKIEYIKEHTNGLNNIDLSEIKQLEADVWGNVYVLLNNGMFYSNGTVEDDNVKEIVMYDDDNVYIIKEDNTITPFKNKKYWNDLDIYLYNEGKPYKKIITRFGNIVGLTLENRVVSVSFFGLLGIMPENFIDVEDIVLKNNKIYVIKEGKEIPLYITGEWEERIYK